MSESISVDSARFVQNQDVSKLVQILAFCQTMHSPSRNLVLVGKDNRHKPFVAAINPSLLPALFDVPEQFGLFGSEKFQLSRVDDIAAGIHNDFLQRFALLDETVAHSILMEHRSTISVDVADAEQSRGHINMVCSFRNDACNLCSHFVDSLTFIVENEVIVNDNHDADRYDDRGFEPLHKALVACLYSISVNEYRYQKYGKGQR